MVVLVEIADLSANRDAHLDIEAPAQDVVLRPVLHPEGYRRDPGVVDGLGAENLGRHAHGRGVLHPDRDHGVRRERDILPDLDLARHDARGIALWGEVELAASRKRERGGGREDSEQGSHGRYSVVITWSTASFPFGSMPSSSSCRIWVANRSGDIRPVCESSAALRPITSFPSMIIFRQNARKSSVFSGLRRFMSSLAGAGSPPM